MDKRAFRESQERNHVIRAMMIATANIDVSREKKGTNRREETRDYFVIRSSLKRAATASRG